MRSFGDQTPPTGDCCLWKAQPCQEERVRHWACRDQVARRRQRVIAPLHRPWSSRAARGVTDAAMCWPIDAKGMSSMCNPYTDASFILPAGASRAAGADVSPSQSVHPAFDISVADREFQEFFKSSANVQTVLASLRDPLAASPSGHRRHRPRQGGSRCQTRAAGTRASCEAAREAPMPAPS